jgi:N-carbamoylputrescine amidase
LKARFPIGEELKRVTVCELSDDPQVFDEEWPALAAHARAAGSQLALLPEMPFYPWLAVERHFEPEAWRAAAEAHRAWQARLPELAAAIVAGTQPVTRDEKRLNEGFVWTQGGGYRPVHTKYYLPDDEGYWEASWYQRGDGSFDLAAAGAARLGFLICSELWFPERARAYGKAGAHLLLTPRATGKTTVEKWLVGGRAAAVIAGAYSLSSNRVGKSQGAAEFGGQGWIIDPDGQVLGVTSSQQPFLTLEIDLDLAVQARNTYPRYILD